MSEDATHSNCRCCGTDNTPIAVNGPPGTDKHNWSTFVCGGDGPGSGAEGCGLNYSVTTRAGVEHNTAVGTDTLGKVTDDVASGRSYSMPSDAYQANYDRAFKKGIYAP